MDINLRIAGQAGQGVQTVGNLLVGALANKGLHVFATQSYMSRIRGGLNWFDIRVADRELFTGRQTADLLVALTDDALEILAGHVCTDGQVLYNGDRIPERPAAASSLAAINFTKAAKDAGGSPIMANMVASGAVYAIVGYDCEELCDHLRNQFGKKTPDATEKNIACVRHGYRLAGEHAGRIKAPSPAHAPDYVISGAETIGLSAACAGVKFAAAYPMTPSTATFTYLAQSSDKYGIVVEQAEDEIAAVNMICGAAYAGIPAMTMTSGGGFALMVEGLSLAGIMELPIVIVVAQRPGPATGLPTRTAQQDLMFALHGGHGEFPRAVFAPGTHEQCYELTRRGLELAHKYQTPVIILTDQFLQDTRKNIVPFQTHCNPIDRCVVSDAPSSYVRYAVTDDGVSPRAIPGQDAFVVCDSDEHDQDGHISEDLRVHVAQHSKRMRKLDGLRSEAIEPQLYGPSDAQTLLLCWGSTYGPCREAVDRLGAQDKSVAMLHFSQVWPIRTSQTIRAIESHKRIISVEGNSTAQLASLLRESGVSGQWGQILRFDGLPFTADYIIAEFSRIDT